jgi:hypothetical protein
MATDISGQHICPIYEGLTVYEEWLYFFDCLILEYGVYISRQNFDSKLGTYVTGYPKSPKVSSYDVLLNLVKRIF